MKSRSKMERFGGKLVIILLVIIGSISASANGLEGDGKPSCSTWPPPCSQICHRGNGREEVSCSCVNGYNLNNSVHCVAEKWKDGQESALLVYGNDRKIIATPIDKSKSKTLYEKDVAETENGLVLAVDALNEEIFFCDERGNKVQSVFLNLTENDVIVNGLKMVTSMSVDWIGRNLYIADSALGKILACSLSTRACVDIIEVGTSNLISLVVDSTEGKLYWSNCGRSNSLEMSNLDGSDREMLLGGVCAESLTFDQPLNTLFWYDSNSVLRILNVKTKLQRSLEFPEVMDGMTTIALFEDKFIWASTLEDEDDYGGQHVVAEILTADKFSLFNELHSSETKPVVRNIIQSVSHMHVMHRVLQPQRSHACSTSRCSHVCLLKGSNGHRCACPDDMVLQTDGRSCIADWSKPAFVLSYETDLLRVGASYIGGIAGETPIHSGSNKITSIAFNWSTKMIFVSLNGSQNELGTIAGINFSGTSPIKQTLFTDVSYITDMDVDWISGNIYWVDYKKKTIEVGRLNGQSRAILVQRSDIIEQPRAVSVDPLNGRLYYSDCGRSPHIGFCNLDGSGCRNSMFKTGSGCIVDIFIDRQEKTIYFILESQIMATNLNLTESARQRHGLQPYSVAALGSSLFWNDVYSGLNVEDSVDSSQQHITFGSEKTHLGPMILVSESMQPPLPNKCSVQNGGCSDICIPVGSDQRRCLCPDEANLETDGARCKYATGVSPKLSIPLPPSNVERRQTEMSSGGASEEIRFTTIVVGGDIASTCGCMNGGFCVTHDGRKICKCPPGFLGEKCESREERLVAGASTSQSSSTDKLHLWLGAALGLVAVVTAVLVAFVLYLKGRRR